MTKYMTNLHMSDIYMTSILARENYQIPAEIPKFMEITKLTRANIFSVRSALAIAAGTQ